MPGALYLGEDGVGRLVLAGIIDILQALGGRARRGRHAEQRRRLAQQAGVAHDELAADLGGHAVFQPRRIGHHQPSRPAHAVGHEVPVGMADRIEIDDLGRDTGRLLDILRGAQRLQHHHRGRHDRDVLARAGHVAGERHPLGRRGNREVEIVEKPVLDADHRAGMAIDDRGIHVEDRLAGRRHHHGQSRIVREGRLRALRMLRPLPPAAADDDADQHRTAHQPAKHVAVLRGQVDDLVHRQEGEVGADVRGDRIVADQRRADCHAGHALFHQRHVEHAGRAVLLGQSRRRAEDAFEVVDPLPHDEGIGMVGEGCIHGLEQRPGIGQHARALGGRLGGHDSHQITSVSSSSRPGEGLASAKATASAISRSRSARRAAASAVSTISGSRCFQASTASLVR